MATGTSLTDLIAECEDYVRTEQFTRELGDKILQMFLEEREAAAKRPKTNDDQIDNIYEKISLVDEKEARRIAEKTAKTLTSISNSPTPPPAKSPGSRSARMEKILEKTEGNFKAFAGRDSVYDNCGEERKRSRPQFKVE